MFHFFYIKRFSYIIHVYLNLHSIQVLLQNENAIVCVIFVEEIHFMNFLTLMSKPIVVLYKLTFL